MSWHDELPALAELSAEDAAAAIAAMTVTRRRLVPLWEIAEAARTAGWWLTAKARCVAQGEVPASLAALAFFDYYSDPRFENIDMDNTAAVMVLAGLVQDSVLTQEQADALSAMANETVVAYPNPPHAGDIAILRAAQ